MAVKRTFGWVQNPGDLKKSKKVVGIFKAGSAENLDLVSNKLPLLLTYGLISNDDYNDFIAELNKTDIEIDYSKLKGKGSGSRTRKDAICTGIIQAIIEAQQNKTYSDVAGNSITIKKPYTDDWTAEGFLRWAISCGLLEYVKDDDKCKITPLGEELANAPDNSPAETEALTKALLSYPPVIRILSLLEAQDEQTKFDLGSKLGFKGEMGFTSMPQDAYLCDYCEATTAGERTNVRSNEEGDSDKYARGIASWCMQMGWVESNQKDVTETYRRKSYAAKLQTYSITRKGEKALIKARGNSSNPRLARVLMFEMLASNKVSSANYLRFVRACIIKALTSSDKSTDQLKKALKGYELDVDDTAIKDHIEGLISIGLEITENAGKYRLLDKIECLEIPARTECVKDNVVDIKDRVRNKLIHLDHKYLALIDLAYSDAASRAKKNADAREFEIQTADLFTKELSFNGQRLGDSRKPDVIISYGLDGTIVDNKSYKDGFNISRTCADEMSRYINENNLRQKSLNPNEWWKNFDSTITAYTFLFITSYLKGQFEDQLEYVSNANGGIKGAAIGVESLLYLSEGIKAGRISHADFYSNFNNKEMIYTA